MNEKVEKIKRRFEDICFGPHKELIDKTIAIEIVQEILEEIPEIPLLETAEFNNDYELPGS
jgi:hypothetical protein